MKKIAILLMMMCTGFFLSGCKKSKTPCPPDMHERIMPNGGRVCVPDYL